MKKPRTHSLLHLGLAAVLACGLMVPATALAADEQEEATPSRTLADSAGSAVAASAADSGSIVRMVEALASATALTPMPLDDSFVTVGHFQISGGKQASSLTDAGDYYHDGTTLHILTSTPLTIKTTQTTTQNIQVEAGVKADLTLAGVNISTTVGAPINLVTNITDTADGSRAVNANQIRNKTTLYLTLADGSTNNLSISNAETRYPGIRCGWGSVLVIDDSVTNIKAGGSKFNLDDIVVPVNGMVGSDVTLLGGTSLKKGDSLVKLEGANPGKLVVTGGGLCAGIGSGSHENAGTLIFNGGDITATTSNCAAGGDGAGIGGGAGGSGTVITFNGGRVKASPAYCGAGIGAGLGYFVGSTHMATGALADAIEVPTGEENSQGYSFVSALTSWSAPLHPSTHFYVDQVLRGTNYHTVAGDITVNGGFVDAYNSSHGNAFGQSCAHGPSSNKDHIIKVTGGTLLTHVNPIVETGSASCPPLSSIGADLGYTIVTGGSVQVQNYSSGKPAFQGLGGTAYNTAGINSWADVEAAGGSLPDNDKVFMITINLASEIINRNTAAGITTDTNLDDRIYSWDLLIGGYEYDYGAPYQFSNGLLYLWLPASATQKEITVDLSYIDKNGKEQKIEPLFRDPSNASQGGDVLKRYVSFKLPSSVQTTKYYDGTPLEGLSIGEGSFIVASDDKKLDDGKFVTYKYQLYDAIDGNPLGVESASVDHMPVDAGVMKLTVDSDQYSKGDPDGFGQSYWGHRATGWCEILPTTSKIDLVSATWFDGKDGSVKEDGRQQLTVNATVRPGDLDPDGKPNGASCQAPRGYIQLYVDGNAVGDPVKMVFEGDLDEKGNKIEADSPLINAHTESNGTGSYTTFEYVFVPAEKDFLVPDATSDNKHEVSVQYLPPNQGEAAPANYLASINPADDPSAPTTEVVIEPVRPKTSVSVQPDPGADSSDPQPTITMSPTSQPTDPASHPTDDVVYPGDQTFTGTLATSFDEPTDENPHPGRVTLNIMTESSGSIRVVDDEGNPFTADFLRDENGEPVRNPDGTFTLVLDPTAPGKGNLHIVQEPNGAFSGTHWDIDVDIKPNPKIPPQTSVAKQAENLTHPNGPTQPGDRIRYTITATNSAKGSAWYDVVLSDSLPAGLTLDESTLWLSNPGERIDVALTAGTGAGTYALTDGGRTLTVQAGAVYGVGSATLTFECTVDEDIIGPNKPTPNIENIAYATGERSDPDHPDDPDARLPENPKPSDPAAPPSGGDPNDPNNPGSPSGTVLPLDPEMTVAKTVENTAHPGSDRTQVGDTLRYTITVANAGKTSSCLVGAMISDPLPAGIEPIASTMRMTLPDGTEKAVADAAYDAATRTIAVTAGDLWGGQTVKLTFECLVGEEALGQNNANIANVYGTVPSQNPGPNAIPTGEEAGNPTPMPPGAVEPAAVTPAAEPPAIVGADPAAGDLSVTKEATNLTRDDGTTRIGDTVRYFVTLKNSGSGTSWMDAVIRDDVPVGLEPVTNTLKMTLPDGTQVDVSDRAYDSATRVLAVSAGRVHGGQSVVLVFDALVTEDAAGADIGNQAYALGKPPSKWTPDDLFPAAGQPFDPPAGWADFEQTSDRITSNISYAPGTDATHAPLSPDGQPTPTPSNIGPVDNTTTIKYIQDHQHLAGTGDAPLVVLPLALMAAAGALLALSTCKKRTIQ